MEIHAFDIIFFLHGLIWTGAGLWITFVLQPREIRERQHQQALEASFKERVPNGWLFFDGEGNF